MAGKLMKAVRRGQRGMTTAEYAVGSVAVATGCGAIITILQQEWFQNLMKVLVEALVAIIKSLMGA